MRCGAACVSMDLRSDVRLARSSSLLPNEGAPSLGAVFFWSRSVLVPTSSVSASESTCSICRSELLALCMHLPPSHGVLVAADIQRVEARDAKGCDDGQPRLDEDLSGASRRASRREDGLVAPTGPLHVGHEALGAPRAQAPQPAVRGGFRGDMQE
eukprot:scaffold40434_cov69-Phaeocystis_antarctica.AAC.2